MRESGRSCPRKKIWPGWGKRILQQKALSDVVEKEAPIYANEEVLREGLNGRY